jgi:glycosyltransferase involved in cell wall biosynthesis
MQSKLLIHNLNGLLVKISVITVSYNSAATIADTVRSVACQSHNDIEHLVIDGLSTDDTVKVVEANRHSNLALSSEPDMGIYDAMNKGLTRATGEIIGFLNADDFFADTEVLARVVKAFEGDSRVEACFGDLFYVTEDNLKVVRYWKSRAYEIGCFARGWSPAHPTFYIRRSALNRLGQFDLTYRLAADIEFMMRYLERGAVRSAYIPHVQVRMRVGGATNQSWRNIALQNREIIQAFKKNKLAYSLPTFALHKLVSRLWQRLTGFNMMGST